MYFTSSGINTSESHQGQSNHTETTDAWYTLEPYIKYFRCMTICSDDMQLYTNTEIHEHRDRYLSPFLMLFLISTSININKNSYGLVKLLMKCATISCQAAVASITVRWLYTQLPKQRPKTRTYSFCFRWIVPNIDVWVLQGFIHRDSFRSIYNQHFW